jgi:glutamate dehydrogenase/leucine dehydrogenase
VPDVISNSGGIIHVAGEFLGWSSETIARRIEAAVTRTADVLREARARAITPLEVVSQRAASRLQVPV